MTETGELDESGFTLLLPDELFILCLNEETGLFPPEPKFHQALAGAALLELALQGRLTQDGRASFMIVDSTDSPDTLMNGLLDDLQRKLDNRFLKFWITQPSAFPNLVHRMMERQARTGLLIGQQDNFLSVFGSEEKFAFSQSESLVAVLTHLDEATQTEQVADDRTFAFLKLVQATLPVLGHVLDTNAWASQPNPPVDEEAYDVVLIENICTVIRSVLQAQG